MLVVLKVLAVQPVAHWPWLWVLCPFWAPYTLILLAFVLACIFGRRD